jgi:nitrite reductase/ring-hydroxylating ferredoxin subunit
MSGAIYAICGVRDMPNRRAKGFSLLRRAEDGGEVAWHIVVLRWDRKIYGYVNRCPHHGERLDWEPKQFLDSAGQRIVCGKHGATFLPETGLCDDGPCRGHTLEPIRLVIADGDVCVAGVELVEDAPAPAAEAIRQAGS